MIVPSKKLIFLLKPETVIAPVSFLNSFRTFLSTAVLHEPKCMYFPFNELPAIIASSFKVIDLSPIQLKIYFREKRNKLVRNSYNCLIVLSNTVMSFLVNSAYRCTLYCLYFFQELQCRFN